MFAANVGASCRGTLPVKENDYGLPDVLTYGSAKVRDKLATCHPLQKTETDFALRQERMEFDMLRKTQGLHAPIRLAMERRAAAHVGRLPFLPSSDLQLKVLRGDLDQLDFTDILHTPDQSEGPYQPHAVVERSLGLL